MVLKPHNMLRILATLKSNDLLNKVYVSEIAGHLDKLIKYDQFEASEDSYGNLIYAGAWWLLSDKALEDFKNGIDPRRINRGPNMVGLFIINGGLSISSLLRVIRLQIRIANPRTFTVYSARGKWLTFNCREKIKRSGTQRRAVVSRALEILRGV